MKLAMSSGTAESNPIWKINHQLMNNKKLIPMIIIICNFRRVLIIKTDDIHHSCIGRIGNCEIGSSHSTDDETSIDTRWFTIVLKSFEGMNLQWELWELNEIIQWIIQFLHLPLQNKFHYQWIRWIHRISSSPVSPIPSEEHSQSNRIFNQHIIIIIIWYYIWYYCIILLYDNNIIVYKYD